MHKKVERVEKKEMKQINEWAPRATFQDDM